MGKTIQEVFELKENLQMAVEICLDTLGTVYFQMLSKNEQHNILLAIGKYYNKRKEKENE